MKPWSGESQEALKLLLKFYRERNFSLSYCPLCKSVGYPDDISTRFGCKECPWMIMKKQPCYLLLINNHTSAVKLRNFVNFSVKGHEELDKDDLKAIDIRIRQLEKWIKFYEEN